MHRPLGPVCCTCGGGDEKNSKKSVQITLEGIYKEHYCECMPTLIQPVHVVKQIIRPYDTDPDIGPLAVRSLDCWSSSDRSFRMFKAACPERNSHCSKQGTSRDTSSMVTFKVHYHSSLCVKTFKRFGKKSFMLAKAAFI